MSNVGRVCMEPAKRARPWGTFITQTASPAALVVSKAVILWVSIMLFFLFSVIHKLLQWWMLIFNIATVSNNEFSLLP